MKKYILLILTTIIFSIAHAPPTSAASLVCSPLEIVWLRGSGQALNDTDYKSFTRAIRGKFQLEQTSPDFSLTELEYPAVSVSPTTYVGLVNSFGAYFSSGQEFAYGASVNTGVSQLINHYRNRLSDCPDTHFVFAGFSQGAQVIADALPQLDPNRIIYITLFGEPRLSLPEGIGAFPAACRGNALSEYRVWAPNCYTHTGALGARSPYIPDGWDDKVGLWCNSRDIICGSSKTFADMSLSAAGHKEYRSNGQMSVAASKIYNRLTQELPSDYFRPIELIESYHLIPPLQPAMDTVLIVDSTGSMGKHIDALRTPVLEFIRESSALYGRTAIIEYRDEEDEPEFPRVLCDFFCTPDEVEAKLLAISPDLTTGNDPPEGLLLALMTAYDSLDWRTGATKNAIVLTDNTFHDPDRTSSAIITLPKIVFRSKQIDPVNTFIFTTMDMNSNSKLQALASQTDGALFPLDLSSDPTDETTKAFRRITSRPVALLALDHYYAKPGDTVTLNAGLSYGVTAPITKYEWDFDADGIYDHESSSYKASFVANSSYRSSGLVVVRVTDSHGLSATMSAAVDITNFPPDLQEPPGASAPPPAQQIVDEDTPPQNNPTKTAETLASASSPKPPFSPMTGAAIGTDATKRNLLGVSIAAIILILWISKQFWSQGAQATSVVTQQSSY